MTPNHPKSIDIAILQTMWADPRLLVLLLVLTYISAPATVKQLCNILSASSETITIKLRTLSTMGFVTRPRVRGGWLLTKMGWQFMLAADDPSSILASSTTQTEDIVSTAVVVDDQIADSQPKSTSNRGYSAISPDVVTELRHNGIGINARVSEIARRDYITPAYIRHHANRLRKIHKHNPGLLITILDNHDPIAIQDIDRSSVEARKRYNDWEK